MGRKARPVAERFWEKVDKSGDCWLWTAGTFTGGYGTFGIRGEDGSIRMRGAHRVSWFLANGPITDGMCVLHHCDTPACVNPDHLFLGTQKDNVDDMMEKGRGRYPRYHVDEDDAIRLYLEGLSTRKLASKFGVSQFTIWKILKRRGVTRTMSEAGSIRNQHMTFDERKARTSAARAAMAAKNKQKPHQDTSTQDHPRGPSALPR